MIVEVMNSLQRLSWLHQRFGGGTVSGGDITKRAFLGHAIDSARQIGSLIGQPATHIATAGSTA
jgi:hypothetical protein